MSQTIYELTKEQSDLLDKLFWADNEEAVEIGQELNKISGTVTKKLEWLTTILLEVQALKIARKEALERYKKSYDKAALEEERLKDFFRYAMAKFDLKKIKGPETAITLLPESISVVYSKEFAPLSLPHEFLKTTEVVEIADKKAFKNYLIESGDQYEGVELVKKHGLRVG